MTKDQAFKQMRAAFEAHIAKDCGDLSTFGSGKNMHYRNSAVNHEWEGWKARALLQSQPAQQAQKPVAHTTTEELEFLKYKGRASAMLFNFTEPDQKFVALYTGPQRELVQQARDALQSRCGTNSEERTTLIPNLNAWLEANP